MLKNYEKFDILKRKIFVSIFLKIIITKNDDDNNNVNKHN